MKIQLVNPPVPNSISRCTRSGCFPPLDLLSLGTYLSANLPGVDVEILDGDILSLSEIAPRLDADLVGLSPKVFSYPCCLELAKIAHQRGALTVMGGAWASSLYGPILLNRPYVDVVVLGEGEKAILGIAAKHNFSRVPNIAYRCDDQVATTGILVTELDELPEVDYSLVDLDIYMQNYRMRFPVHGVKRPLSYYSQRGCYWYDKSGGCIFCRKQYSQNVRRSPTRFWRDVEHLTSRHALDLIWDVSDTFTEPMHWVEALASSKPGHIQCQFYLYARASDLDATMVSMLRTIGCMELLLGVESGNDELLRSANKGISRKMTIDAVQLCAEHSIEVFPTFLLGLPNEDAASLSDTISLAHQLVQCGNIHEISSAILSPLPGSNLYHNLCRRLGSPDWLVREDNIDLATVQRTYVTEYTKTNMDSLIAANDAIGQLVDVDHRSSFGLMRGPYDGTQRATNNAEIA